MLADAATAHWQGFSLWRGGCHTNSSYRKCCLVMHFMRQCAEEIASEYDAY